MLEVPTEPGPQSSRENRTGADPVAALQASSCREIDLEPERVILYDRGAVVCALPYPAGFYNELTPLMHDIRRDGLDL